MTHSEAGNQAYTSAQTTLATASAGAGFATVGAATAGATAAAVAVPTAGAGALAVGCDRGSGRGSGRGYGRCVSHLRMQSEQGQTTKTNITSTSPTGSGSGAIAAQGQRFDRIAARTIARAQSTCAIKGNGTHSLRSEGVQSWTKLGHSVFCTPPISSMCN